MELVSKAIIFATKAHDKMRRKNSEVPYIIHPLEAAVIVSTMTSNQEVIAAAVLHDVVEDAGITIEQVYEEFGEYVRFLVASETENKRENLPSDLTWKIRKEESLEDLKNAKDINILKIWLGDKLANIRSIYEEWKINGDKMWVHFNQKDPKEHAWYYKTIAEYTSALKEYRAWQEYNEIVRIVFGKGE
jgi:myo-inositol-1(or 4)-monophosphatase